MTRILICDDSNEDLESISEIIKEFYDSDSSSLAGTSYSLLPFSSPELALSYTEDGGVVDIAILDIMMADMNGMELASHMRDLG